MNLNGKANGLVRKLPPQLPGGLPLLGHALAFARNPVRLLQRGRDKFGEVFHFRLLGRQMAVLTGPKANEAFFRASNDVLSARTAYQFTVPIFGKGIAYDASAERMDAQLDLLMPALNERRLRTYAGYINEEVEGYLEQWSDRGEVDLLAATNELTVFIASRCLIGREFRRNLSAEFARLYHDLEGGINLLAFFWPYLPLPSFRRRDRARARMVQIISRIMAERRAAGKEEEDFLQTLMAARWAEGSALTDDHITGMLLTLIFAGQHTSAVQAAWTGVELLRHPQYLEPILREQEAILADHQELSFEALGAMVLLERAIQESERLHPPLVMLMREILSDFSYGQYVMPAGWLALISPAVSHRLPEVFPDPERYDPERFSPERQEHRKVRHAIITFGGGKHACIGMTFAYLQVKAIWSVLLRRFELELIDPDPVANYATFVVGPKPPCRLRYKRRVTRKVFDNLAPAAVHSGRESKP
jgi:sterol 14alpha-demethylase